MSVFPSYQNTGMREPESGLDELRGLFGSWWDSAPDWWSRLTKTAPDPTPSGYGQPGWNVTDALSQIGREHAELETTPTIRQADPWQEARNNSQTSWIDWLSPTLGNALQGQPYDASSLIGDLVGWADAPAKGLVGIIGAPLFKNKKLAGVLQDSLAKVVGPEDAKWWGNQAKDVPVWMEDKPALNMLDELYHVLGIQDDTSKMGRFGAEIEGSARVTPEHVNYLLQEHGAPRWETHVDRSVRSTPDFPYPFEAVTKDPLQGMESIKQFYDDVVNVAQPTDNYYGPFVESGARNRAGGHVNLSWEDMSVPEIRKLVEIYQKQEPYTYPLSVDSRIKKEQRDAWAAPSRTMMEHFTDDPQNYGRAFGDRSVGSIKTIGAAAAMLPNKYNAINLAHLGRNTPEARVEFRAPRGSVDPEDWLKQFIIAEIQSQEARATAGQGNWFGSAPSDFWRNYGDYIQEVGPEAAQSRRAGYGRGYDVKKDPLIPFLEDTGKLRHGDTGDHTIQLPHDLYEDMEVGSFSDARVHDPIPGAWDVLNSREPTLRNSIEQSIRSTDWNPRGFDAELRPAISDLSIALSLPVDLSEMQERRALHTIVDYFGGDPSRIYGLIDEMQRRGQR